MGTGGDILGVLCQCIVIAMQLSVLDSNAGKPDNVHNSGPSSQIQVYVCIPFVMSLFDQNEKKNWIRSNKVKVAWFDLRIIRILGTRVHSCFWAILSFPSYSPVPGYLVIPTTWVWVCSPDLKYPVCIWTHDLHTEACTTPVHGCHRFSEFIVIGSKIWCYFVKTDKRKVQSQVWKEFPFLPEDS